MLNVYSGAKRAHIFPMESSKAYCFNHCNSASEKKGCFIKCNLLARFRTENEIETNAEMEKTSFNEVATQKRYIEVFEFIEMYKHRMRNAAAHFNFIIALIR